MNKALPEQEQSEPTVSSRAAPVIVLGYAGCGADQLRPTLSALAGLTCTAGTGIVPLCHQAMSAWQAIDGPRSGEEFSPLAAASVRALSGALVTAILAGDGGSRWCEFASAAPAAGRTFARLYPQTRFLTVHRQAGAAIRAILDANPWGLAGSEFAPFLAASPGSTVAALAAYWAAHTAELLEFEHAHGGSCLRVRIEDFRADEIRATAHIGNFLRTGGRDDPLWFSHENGSHENGSHEDGSHESAGMALPAVGLPLARIPAALLSQLNDLHGRLGYPPVTAADT
jgi:hypothetical protein